MRELTRSMIRFSWAMPLLGMNQMANLVPGVSRRPLDSTTETFDALSEVAVDQMGPTLRDLYEQGDRVGRWMVDAMFGVFDGGERKKDEPARRPAEPRRHRPVGAAPQAAADARHSAARADHGETGWGPVPAQ